MSHSAKTMTLQEYLDYDDGTEYAARGTPDYWIVDPIRRKVTLLERFKGLYKETIFVRNSPIVSRFLGILNLTSNELINTE